MTDQGTTGSQEYRDTYSDFAVLLDEYCGGVRSVLVAEGEPEQAEVLDVMRQAIATQARSLAVTFQEIYDNQDGEGRQAIASFLGTAGAQGMIDQTRALLANDTLQKKPLLSWIGLILDILKELIVMIGELLNLPGKLIKLILAILEILEKILKLIAQFLGSKAAQIADDSDRIFWTSLERYWNTTAALRRNGVLD